MSNFFISLLVSVSVSVWIYNKFFSQRSGSGNTGPAIIASIATGVAIFIVSLITLSLFF